MCKFQGSGLKNVREFDNINTCSLLKIIKFQYNEILLGKVCFNNINMRCTTSLYSVQTL